VFFVKLDSIKTKNNSKYIGLEKNTKQYMKKIKDKKTWHTKKTKGRKKREREREREIKRKRELSLYQL